MTIATTEAQLTRPQAQCLDTSRAVSEGLAGLAVAWTGDDTSYLAPLWSANYR